VSFLGVTSTQGTCVLSGKPATIRCSLGDLTSGGSAGHSVSVKLTAKIGSAVTNLISAGSGADGAGPATQDPDTSNLAHDQRDQVGRRSRGSALSCADLD
jgi:hypothetical protein